jgi:hypothetical protein
MTKKQNQTNGNGAPFQQKVSDDELKKLVKAGMTGRDLIQKTGMRSYSLQNRLYALAARENDVSFLITFPNEVEYTTQRKSRGIHISKSLCDNEEIPENQRFNIEFKKMKAGKSIVLTPVS